MSASTNRPVIAKKFDPASWAASRKAAIANATAIKQTRIDSKPLSVSSAPQLSAKSDSKTTLDSWGWLPKTAVSQQPNESQKHDQLSFFESDACRPDINVDKTRLIIPSSRTDPSLNMSPVQPLDCVDRKISQQAQQVADARLVLNPKARKTNDEIVTRQMLDKNTLRLANRDVFVSAIDLWRSGFGPRNSDIHSFAADGQVKVYVRTRPIFQKELTEKMEFEVVTTDSDKNSLYVHNCLFQPDLRRQFISHSCFTCFDKVFAADCDNLKVYNESCAKEMVHFTLSGGLSAIFMFGQTGSGKTFTMTFLEECAAKEIFRGSSDVSVTIGFIEVAGKKAFDLLSDGPENQEVKMREIPDGSMVAIGANEITVYNAMSLTKLMHSGHSRRATRATGANEESSRSHAICSLKIRNGSHTGKLMLLDCAGSERRKDSMNHDKDTRAEGAEINASLHALKECMRWRAETFSNKKPSSPVPFRGSLLTRILAEVFVKPNATLAVIATISPCATDIEHTLSTLRVVHFLSNRSASTLQVFKQVELSPAEEKAVVIHPGKWTAPMASEWIKKITAGKVNLVSGTTGMMLVRMTENRFIQLCRGDEMLGKHIFKQLHQLIKIPDSADPDPLFTKVVNNRSVPSTASSIKSASTPKS